MKTFTTITLIGLLAWIGFVVIQDGFDYYTAGVFVSPAIFGIVAIAMYGILRHSIADKGDEISTPIGLLCVAALIIAAPYSFFAWLIIEDAYKLQWIPLAIAMLLGLFVLAVFYLVIAAQIRKEKRAIAQGKRAQLEYLQNRQNSNYEYVIYSIISTFVSGFVLIVFGEMETVGVLIPVLFFYGSFVLLFLFVFLPNLEEKIANTEVEFLQSEIAAKQERQRSENVQNKKLISSAADYLEKNPETNHNDWQSIIPEGDASQMKMGAKIALRRFLDQRKFEQARSLLNYYDIDAHQLLRVAKSLEKFEKDNKLNLEPKTFKLTLEDDETAYEKLPCNWQKIHTYLAPLTDELEQSDILDTGNIYITDQRVFFVGKKGSETVSLSDIAYMDLKDDALQFFRDEGLSEIFAFPTAHHAKYAELVIKELMGREA